MRYRAVAGSGIAYEAQEHGARRYGVRSGRQRSPDPTLRNWARARAAEVRLHSTSRPRRRHAKTVPKSGSKSDPKPGRNRRPNQEEARETHRACARCLGVVSVVGRCPTGCDSADPAAARAHAFARVRGGSPRQAGCPDPERQASRTSESLPALPPAKLVSLPDKVTPPVPSSRMLACAGTWLGVASESYECGVARFREGKYDEAARDLGQACAWAVIVRT